MKVSLSKMLRGERNINRHDAFLSGDGKSQEAATKGYCAPYNGQICRKFLQGRGLVWFNISQDNSGGWLNEQIVSNLWNEVIEKLREPCRSAAEALLCKYAFPGILINLK